MKRNLILFVSFFIFNSCENEMKQKAIQLSPYYSILKNKKTNLSKEELKQWHLKDIIDDTIPGTSLSKLYSYLENSARKPIDTVIIAVLDMPVWIDHPLLAPNIWKNKNEIPKNGLDDDSNGYIDDTHGWNFLGRPNESGTNFTQYEYVRILKNLTPLFEDKQAQNDTNSWEFLTFKKAQIAYNSQLNYAKRELSSKMMLDSLNKANKDFLHKYFGDKELSIDDLDSLKNINKKNSVVFDELQFRWESLKYGITDSVVNEELWRAKERIDKLLNLNYDDRTPIGDLEPNNISFNQYGNNNVDYNFRFLDHGTKVAGALLTERIVKIEGFNLNNHIKVMPITIAAYGDEHDKDIALAIKYAVDNGAKVINMSFSKEFSTHPEMVNDAISYADKNDVLIVKSAGNDGRNLDDNEGLQNYPNDSGISTELDTVKNFIKVGSTSYKLTSKLGDIDSNYGKEEVDIFAPGVNIYTTTPNKEQFISGTSYSAPITSKIAALLMVYFPDLSASEVKSILMKSGTEFNIEVVRKDGKKTAHAPFSELSKSGRIVNAYNAFLLAQRINSN